MTSRRVIPERVKREILDEQGWCCFACHQPVSRDQIDVDHRVPLALGGSDDETNWVALCRPCHKQKTRADVKAVRKADRARRMREEGKPRQRKSKPLQGRGFRKDVKRKINGEVVKRDE